MSGPALVLGGLLFGLANAAHCAGMCGAFAVKAASSRARLPGTALYLLGKTFTYVFLGALAGALGARLLGAAHELQIALGAAVGLVLLWVGLRLFAGEARPSRLGATLTGWITPLIGRVPGEGHPGGAFALGAVTGLLPCGVVYLAALQAAALGGAAAGAAFMGAFGIGTGPVLVAVGLAGRGLLGRFGPRRMRLVGATLIVLVGAVALWRAGLAVTAPPDAPGCPLCWS